MVKDDIITILCTTLNIAMPATKSPLQWQIYNLLSHDVDVAVANLQSMGIMLSEDTYAVDEGNLIVMYAAWLYRSRATGEDMPRMLQFAINNMLFGQKARSNAQ